MRTKMFKYYVGLGVIGVFTLAVAIITIAKGSATKQDVATKKKASEIATKLNAYVSKNRKVPESLEAADIKDVPKTITYKKDSASEYTFCVTYKEAYSYGSTDPTSLITGSTLRQSSTTEDADTLYSGSSSYMPSTLYLSYTYKKGENCQTVKPYFYSSSYYESPITTYPSTSTGSSSSASARDVQRRSDINAIHSKLEEYYNENNGYPDGPLSTTVLKGIDSAALIDSDGKTITYGGGFTTSSTAPIPYVSNSIEYVYAAYGCKNTGAQKTVGATCTKYVLRTYLETGSATYYAKNSLN